MSQEEDLFEKIRGGSNEEKKKLADELKSRLTADQSETLKKIMSDKNILNKLMNSTQAKNIIEKLGGDINGHK